MDPSITAPPSASPSSWSRMAPTASWSTAPPANPRSLTWTRRSIWSEPSKRSSTCRSSPVPARTTPPIPCAWPNRPRRRASTRCSSWPRTTRVPRRKASSNTIGRSTPRRTSPSSSMTSPVAPACASSWTPTAGWRNSTMSPPSRTPPGTSPEPSASAWKPDSTGTRETTACSCRSCPSAPSASSR